MAVIFPLSPLDEFCCYHSKFQVHAIKNSEKCIHVHSTVIWCSICSSKKACLNVFSVSHFRNIAKYITEFALHRIGVLLNCVNLKVLLLSSALEVCLKMTTETIVVVKEKDELLAAITQCLPSLSVPDDLFSK